MRLSTIKGDPGHRTDFALKKYRVFLDGVELFDCQIADEERGLVVRQIGVHNPLLRRTFFKRLPPQFGKVEIKERA